MIVYTVQPEFIYKKMREQGYLEGDKKFAMFPEAYKWMIDQMEKRIGNCKVENSPVWLWKRKPSGNEKALAAKGERWVILKLDVPEDKILWSSFDDWHSILNNNPIAFNEEEWDSCNERGFPKEEVIKTWERLFDHEWLAGRPTEWAGKYNEHWMQGVTPRITMEQVKKVTRFIGKG